MSQDIWIVVYPLKNLEMGECPVPAFIYSSMYLISTVIMASSKEKLQQVTAVLPEITHRKMMGEYLLYQDGVLFGGIYDDRLLLKITKASASMLVGYPSAFPYEGGGEMILFTEPFDTELLRKTVDAICTELSSHV